MVKVRLKGQGRARLGFVFAVMAFGLIGIFVRAIPLPPRDIAFFRGLIAFLVLSCFMPFGGRMAGLKANRHQVWKMLLSGAVMGFNWVLVFEAYRHTTVALATLCYYLMPTLVILASALWFKEKLNGRQVFFFVLATAGMALIIGVSGGGDSDLLGILYGLGAAVLYALVILINRATPDVEGISRTWVQFFAAVLTLLPYILLDGGLKTENMDVKGTLMLLMVGAFNTGLLYALYFTVLPRITAQQAAILSYLDPLVAVSLSVFVLGERLSVLQWVGGALLLLSTFMNEWLGRPRADRALDTEFNL